MISPESRKSDTLRCFRYTIENRLRLLSALVAAIFISTSVLASDIDVEALSYYSASYEDARAKFIHSARSAGGTIESHMHPSRGPEGKAIYLDVAYFGPDNADTILILSSGTHGVEGFAGSAIQTGLLLSGISGRLPDNTGLMLMHAINPYGFAHLRRVNEDNVDLNRNFIDHTATYPENRNYEALESVAAPKSLSFWENIKARLHLYWYVVREGNLSLKKAISQGQFSHPEGLFYGGRQETWSNVTLHSIVKKRLRHAKQVMVIDIHTGLGDYGEAEVIMNVPKASAEYQRATDCWGKQVRTTGAGESVSVDIKGALKLALPKMLPDTEVTAISLEFGTYPVNEVFWALRAENWLHHHGTNKYPDRAMIKSGLLQAFYPDDARWKRAVWEEGRELVDSALKCLRAE